MPLIFAPEKTGWSVPCNQAASCFFCVGESVKPLLSPYERPTECPPGRMAPPMVPSKCSLTEPFIGCCFHHDLQRRNLLKEDLKDLSKIKSLALANQLTKSCALNRVCAVFEFLTLVLHLPSSDNLASMETEIRRYNNRPGIFQHLPPYAEGARQGLSAISQQASQPVSRPRTPYAD